MLREVKVENGVVRGLPAADPRITSFKGIPFAAPPVGDLRWRAPQPAKDWDGVLDCYKFAPISMQHIPGIDETNIYTREWNVDPSIPMDEDCLYLNVWTPAKKADEKLPVFVWYFGGGLREGNPAEMEFDGERIARRGIVVVTINYRLNCFGFMTHPEIVAENPDAPANFGHLDQQAGTRWVKRNIAAFGGDPENITIGGQSAGGMSVTAQLCSPQNEGLFQKAIIMSGMGANPYKTSFIRKYSFEETQQLGVKFFEFMGVKTLAEARAIDACTLRDKCEEFCAQEHLMWMTCVDGVYLTEDTDKTLMTRKDWPVPLIVGCTVGETRSPIVAKSMDDFRKLAEHAFPDRVDEYMELIGPDVPTAMDRTRINGAEIAIRVMKEFDKKNGKDRPIWFYRFNPEMPGFDHPGTFHSSDLWFHFENLAKCWRPFTGKHYDLARQMCNALCYYFKNGDPNGLDITGLPQPEWKPYTLEEHNIMYWGDTPQPYVDPQNDLKDFLTEEFRKEFN
ncbi:MAG: carboxylesterase family protein [Oscillospiraceae bacterium]|nr:carboxylesterase family protein [Oscillospiraceae bacterium]